MKPKKQGLLKKSFNSRTREGATLVPVIRMELGSFNSRTREGATLL